MQAKKKVYLHLVGELHIFLFSVLIFLLQIQVCFSEWFGVFYFF